MSRPCKRRRVCMHPPFNEVIVNGSNNEEVINLTIDEFECLRLLDYEKITQEECALKMEVARTTITSIYADARYKLMDALMNGKKIIISGGNFTLCPEHNKCKGYNCLLNETQVFNRKENVEMRIAITYENGNVFEHFGRCEHFKVYDILEDGKIEAFILDSDGIGHGALAGLLAQNKVDLLICGGIGGGAINALTSNGIKVCMGASGSCDELIKKLINKELDFSCKSSCSHHHHHEDGHECHCEGHGSHGNHDCHCK